MRYNAKSRDRIEFSIPKGCKQIYKDYADRHGTSVSALFQDYMNKLISEEKTPE